MYLLKIAFRNLFQKQQHSITRIISLAAGLAFGILMLSEVFYYYSFDSFYPEASRVYVVQSNARLSDDNAEMDVWDRTSGAIAPGMKDEVPGVEVATRLNSIGNLIFYTADQKSYKGRCVLADEYVYDVIPRNMLVGNAKEAMLKPSNCIISSKIAASMGDDAVGKVIEFRKYPGVQLTVAGVFEALPENSNYKYDVLISMSSIAQFFDWDGSTNWLGNDRYYSCVKLDAGVNPKDLAPAIRKMQEKHQDIIKLEQDHGGELLKYTLIPIQKVYVSRIQGMVIILSTIALAVLFVSLMNYVLLTFSSLINRAKSSAVYKTCGATANDLKKIIFTESFVFFVLALSAALVILMAVKPLVENLVAHSLEATLNQYVLWPIVGVLIIFVLLSSYFPGRFFANIPVSAAFRNYKQKKNKWKLGLLSFQFIGASFILTLLVVVTLQYHKMINADHGYRSQGVYYCSTNGIDGSKLNMIMNELRKLPEVEKVGMGEEVPVYQQSGNNIYSQDGKKDLFNIADFYSVDENYLSILDIDVTNGRDFSTSGINNNDVFISKKCAELLKIHNHWEDGVIGKEIKVSEHQRSTIKGVFDDFIIGSIVEPDKRPSVFFYQSEEGFIRQKEKYPSMEFKLLVQAKTGMEANIRNKIKQVVDMALPNKDAVVRSLEDEQFNGYQAQLSFRNGMLAGNVVVFLITIIGLIGYTSTETTRRSKELAIRRISGASISDLIVNFILELQYLVLPSLLIGLGLAWFILTKWMESFAQKMPLQWWIFLLCSIGILLMVAIIAMIKYSRIASRNPVESLRYE
ncbi:ABC transporter permease [Carboxylicivirga linearis]|uniref:ABC transporter permease n=1 Tax=Carboxylicivirga linearis TaxID=1628157 RepID=A0ABS5JR40_9BACT|nr:ABC transporter permease [Carboxylicivirga linearis]MBS2097242.1 ABC transporter permease [Carboxylicivirga linearis]